MRTVAKLFVFELLRLGKLGFGLGEFFLGFAQLDIHSLALRACITIE